MDENRKKIRGPDWEQYITDEKRRRFITYQDGAILYGLRYWPFVRLCQKADANIPLRKTAIVDLDILDDFIEQHNMDRNEEKEADMPARKPKAPIDERMTRNGKKYVRLEEAAELYSVSEKTVEKWAEHAKARYKIDGVKLFNTEKIDRFIETMGQEEDW